jgi:bifunctional UDP-N-acetylglucosamine pyrophosphorylase / glucosamine-1-phosphate N-acetyltransferase
MSEPTRTAAVILAAGKGTRMKSAHPKVLFNVGDKPLCSHVIDAVAGALAAPVVVVVGHGKDAVQRALSARHGDAIAFAEQTEQRGTGHAVQVALPAIGDATAVLVVCGDTPHIDTASLRALIEARAAADAAVALWTTQIEPPTGYGRIVRDGAGAVRGIVEEKDADALTRAVTEVNAGVYCFERAFLAAALPRLTDKNAAGELYLTDVLALAAQDGRAIVDVAVPAAITAGINDRVQLARAEAQFQVHRQEQWMRAGVTFENPATTFVGADVAMDEDVVLGQSVALRGKTSLGRGVVVGQGAILTDTTVEAGATIHPYSVCEKARVGSGASVGPFARLRPAADVGEQAHVGNFVELKKTTLGKGSKANHLAYLGDATIGAGVNVGAGTITCNYDGFGKYPTVLADGVFVGSNSTLVAPLQVGAGAYVAAGSVVTDEVPADSVAFGRARQQNKEGRARALRDAQRTKAGK